jgi:hypothetical protein
LLNGFTAATLSYAADVRRLRGQRENLSTDQVVVQYDVSGLQRLQGFEREELRITRAGTNEEYLTEHG